MTDEFHVIAIAALLPITASMLVFQANPYHALVIRGILGAVAALVYALFGAADVALTEALVGTMLSITLYAVAVRSSLSLRVGVLDHEAIAQSRSHTTFPANTLVVPLQHLLKQHHMRLEWVTYSNIADLQAALNAKEIHAVCLTTAHGFDAAHTSLETPEKPLYNLETRVQRMYDLMTESLPPTIHVTYGPTHPAKASVSVAQSQPAEGSS